MCCYALFLRSMRILIKNIEKLLQTYQPHEIRFRINGFDMKQLPSISNAFLIVQDGKIAEFGKMTELNTEQHFDNEIDAKGRLVLPAWVDSHTHLVHAGTRESEFVDRINGLTYEQIAEKGGGILNSAAKLRNADESAIFDESLMRLEQAISMGTGAIEIKSGYGLTVEAELKMLRVVRKLKEQKRIPVKATLLAAHAYPLEFRTNHQAYIDLVVNEMIPKVATEGLAEYIDVFCEKGFFSVEETAQILQAAAKYGLVPKIHANQLHNSGGIQVGVEHNALSVDHLETLGQEEVACLADSNTFPVLLPGAAFFLGMHYQPARMLLDANLPVVLASDYNPGSCPSANMNFVVSLACTQMKMTPAEAIHACTLNAAAALEMSDTCGIIAEGYDARLVMTTPMHNESMLPYHFGNMPVAQRIGF
jgi:imidazolonepropionase